MTETRGIDAIHVPSSPLITGAWESARRLLRAEWSERWRHTQGVASRSADIAFTVPEQDRPILVAAALLHDIGYAPSLRNTGFHPLDGALYLRSHGWDERITALVAHHSGARFVPADRGFEPLMLRFEFEESPVSDALTYADQTVGRNGRRMTIEYRIAETICHHGPDTPNSAGRVDRVPYLLSVADRVEQRLVDAVRSEV